VNSPKLENAEKKGHYLRLLNVKKKTNLIGWFHRWLSSKLASSVWIRTSASNWRRYKRSMKPKWRAFNSDWKHRRRKCPLSPPKPKVGRQSPQQLPPPMLLHHHPLSYSAVDVDQAPRRTVLERHEHRSYWKNSIFLLFKIIWEKKKRKKKEKKPTETTSSPYSVTLFVPVLVVEQNMEWRWRDHRCDIYDVEDNVGDGAPLEPRLHYCNVMNHTLKRPCVSISL